MTTTMSSPKGTCQVCFHRQVAKAPRRSKAEPTMVLHGYQRPGWGYINGECPGTREVPFELSCEITKGIRSQVTEQLAATQKRLEKAKTGKLKGLAIRMETGYHYVGRRRQSEYVEFTILPGWRNPDISYSCDTWESRLRSHISSLESDIRQLEGFIKELTGRIDSWHYAPENIKGEPVPTREIDVLSAWYFAKETQDLIDKLGLRETVKKIGARWNMLTSRGNYTKAFYQAVKLLIERTQAAT